MRFRQDHLSDLYLNLEGVSSEVNKSRELNPSYTWIDSEDNILGSVGLIPIWPGLVETWAIFSQNTKYHPLRYELVKDIRKLHFQTSMILKFRRAQSLVSEDFRDGHALVLRLGYKFESKMPDYGPLGETFYRYVWLAKDHIK